MMPPRVFPDPLKAMEDAAYTGVEAAADSQPAEYDKDSPAVYVRPYRPEVNDKWRDAMDGGFHTKEGDFIQVRPRVDYGGDKTYPDEAPYNYTHRPQGYFSALRGASSAYNAVIFAEAN